MRFEDDEDGQTAIFEVIGPNPSMFTQAMFFALLGSVTFLFAVIIGFSQISLGISPTLAFTVTSISALLVAIAFIVLAIGRMKAADQVNGLKKFVKRILTS